jgi:SPP1 gp7 family putative phage head morphogenesis protein
MLATTLNLSARVHRPSRKPITLAKIETTLAQEQDLFAVYKPVIAAWEAAQPRIMAEYERTIVAMTTDAPSDVQGQIDSVAAEINRLVIMLTPDLRRWALKVEQVHRSKWVRSVMSATDVNLDTVLTAGDVNDTIDASLNWNVSLIRDVSSELQKRVANSVFAGFQRRAPAPEIAKEITEATGMARARARRIASDQTVKLGSRLNQARQEQAGITSFKWRHSAKRHPREWHLQRDGKVYPWRGNSIPADDMPGVPPFCGCTAQGILTFD